MTARPERWKDSEEVDATTRALLRAGSRTRSLSPTHRRRGELRVARIAAVPAVALSLGLWTKVVAAAFGAGVASTVAVVVVFPAARDALDRIRPPAASSRGPAVPPSALLAGNQGALGGNVRPPVEAVAPEQSTVVAPLPPSPGAAAKPSGGAGRVAARAPSAAVGDVPSGVASARPAPSGSAPSLAFSLTELAPNAAPSAGLAVGAPARSLLAAEVALLAEARRLVSSDPDSALALLNRHSKEFPSGALATEREVMVIDCLRRTARGREAAARAEGLLQASPDALYRSRLKRATER